MFGTWTIINGASIYPEDMSIMDAIEDYDFDWIISIDVGHGWCARLSKHDEAGILVDCTEWVGPFISEDAAADNINQTYREN